MWIGERECPYTLLYWLYRRGCNSVQIEIVFVSNSEYLVFSECVTFWGEILRSRVLIRSMSINVVGLLLSDLPLRIWHRIIAPNGMWTDPARRRHCTSFLSFYDFVVLSMVSPLPLFGDGLFPICLQFWSLKFQSLCAVYPFFEFVFLTS